MENNKKIHISIIIATFNSEKTIRDCLLSIKKQTNKNYELIIIDKVSKDNTIKIIRSLGFKKIKIIIEKDNGIYDAINKGIKNSKGDIISILHSDDLYHNKNVLKNVISSFKKNSVDIVYGNLIYVFKNNPKKIIRIWKPGKFKNDIFKTGWNPPHPSFFVKKTAYKKQGLYKNKLGNPADIELMFRFLQQKKLKYKYIDKYLVKMRYGGASNKNLNNILTQNIKILKILNIEKDIIKIIYFIVMKTMNRISQFIITK